MKKAIIIFILAMNANNNSHALSCLNCATWWGQIANKYEIIQQNIISIEQLRSQLLQYKMDIENSRSLSSFIRNNGHKKMLELYRLTWQTSRDVNEVKDLSKNIESEYKEYGHKFAKKDSYSNTYRRWSDRNKKSMESAYRTAGLQSKHIQNEQATMDNLSRQLKSATGTLQALQVSAQISQQQIVQMQQLRMLIAAQMKFNTDANMQQAEQNNISNTALYRSASTDNIKGLGFTQKGHRAGQEFKHTKGAFWHPAKK